MIKQKNWFKRNFDILLLVLFVLPILFINVQHSTDWGGDFAMYINEALNIAHLHPIADTHYLYNENAPMLGPPSYPVGFPLLLSPVCLFFGNNIAAMIIYMSLIVIVLAFVLQLFFRQYFSKIVSLVLVLVILYNPWTLHFKNEILADIPFTLFFIITLVLPFRKAPLWLIGLSMGFTILIKTAGFVLPVGFFLYAFYQFIRTPKDCKAHAKKLLIPAGYSILLVLLVNKVLFHLPSGFDLYSGNFNLHNLVHNFLINISLYIEIYQSFFFQNLHDWKFIILITQAVLFTFALVGMVNSKKNLLFFVVGTYLLLLFFYPYHSSGFRFLLPVLPMMLIYAVIGFKSIRWNFTLRKPILIPLLAVFLLGQSVPHIITMAKTAPKILSGPQEPASQEAFMYIRQNIPEKEPILFTKPRVLALFTQQDALCNEWSDSTLDIVHLLKKKQVHYILTNNDLSNPALDRFLKEKAAEVSPVWKNKKFRLYWWTGGKRTGKEP